MFSLMLIATVPYVGKRLHLDPEPDPDPNMQIISDPDPQPWKKGPTSSAVDLDPEFSQ